MPLAPLYGALIASDAASLDDGERSAKLREAADAFVKVRSEMQTLASDDPEVTQTAEQGRGAAGARRLRHGAGEARRGSRHRRQLAPDAEGKLRRADAVGSGHALHLGRRARKPNSTMTRRSPPTKRRSPSMAS